MASKRILTTFIVGWRGEPGKVGTVLGKLGSVGQFHTMPGNQFTTQIISLAV